MNWVLQAPLSDQQGDLIIVLVTHLNAHEAISIIIYIRIPAHTGMSLLMSLTLHL